MQSHENNAQIILSLDVGGSFIKSALIRNGEIIREREKVPSCSGGSAGEIAAALRRAAVEKVDAIAVAIPGPFDYHRGVSLMEHKFAAVKGMDLKKFLPDVPVKFIHDANAFLLGEWNGESRMGAITLGTGIGAAVIVNGELLVNDLGSPAPKASLWNKPFCGMTVEEALDLRNHGPGQPPDKWHRFGELLAEILTPWSEQFQLEKIVIGGQIANDFELFKEPLQKLPVDRSKLGEKAALLGTARQFFKEKPCASFIGKKRKRACLGY